MKFAKNHNTATRRFKAGDEVLASEIDGALSAEDLIGLGILEPDADSDVKKPKKQTAALAATE